VVANLARAIIDVRFRLPTTQNLETSALAYRAQKGIVKRPIGNSHKVFGGFKQRQRDSLRFEQLTISGCGRWLPPALCVR